MSRPEQKLTTRIIRSTRRSVSLTITPTGELVIKAPENAPDAVILEFVAKKRRWIARKVEEAKERSARVLSFDLPPYKLATIEKRAQGVLAEITRDWAARMEVKPLDIKTTKARTLWGSCTGRDVIRLNWRLLLVPAECREYVVVHELAHIRHKNHSREFWSMVETHCPEYKNLRQKLQDYAPLLQEF